MSLRYHWHFLHGAYHTDDRTQRERAKEVGGQEETEREKRRKRREGERMIERNIREESRGIERLRERERGWRSGVIWLSAVLWVSDS